MSPFPKASSSSTRAREAGPKDAWIVGGSAPGHVEYGQGDGIPGLVADQSATVTAGIPIIYDGQPAVTHSPQDRPRSQVEQQEQQQQAGPNGMRQSQTLGGMTQSQSFGSFEETSC